MKISILINNSYSTINNLPTALYAELRKELSYKDSDMAALYSAFGPRTYYLINKKGELLTGLVPRAIKVIEALGYSYEIVDKRNHPVKGKEMARLDITLYKAQHEATDAALHFGRGVISMPTGTGKSILIANIINSYNLPTLVVVPNIELKSQLSQTLKELLPARTNITVLNIDSPSLNKLSGKNLLIVDEAHHAAAKTYQNLNKGPWKDIYHRFYLTATPFRNDHNEQLLFEGMTGSIIYNLTYKKAIQEGYIVPVEGYYLEVPKVHSANLITWRQVYSQLVVNNEARNELIAYTALQLASNKLKTLILVKEVEHGNILSKMTNIPFSNGKDEDSREFITEFNQGRLNALIGTTGIIGEGVDTKPCEYVIIAGLGKAKSAFMQQVGRAVRRYEGKESAKVIIIKDSSHKFTKAHFNTQKKILVDNYGVTLVKLEV